MTTLDPMAEVEQIRKLYGEFGGLYDPAQAVAHVRILLAEVDRLNSWAGLMSVLDKHYPPDVIGGNSRDPGVRHVVLVRKLNQLGIELEAAREENRQLHARVDELDGVERELATEREYHKRYLEMHDGACARLSAELDRLLPVVASAKALREAESASPYLGAPPELVDLIAAVDALGTDAADGAGTGEQVRWRDEWRVSTLGHYRRAATERHSWSDEKTFEGAVKAYRLCVAEGTLTEPISWREPWIEHRRTAETEWRRIEPAASPAGSSTADEGARVPSIEIEYRWCSKCEQDIVITDDGLLVRHRQPREPNSRDLLGPWCSASGASTADEGVAR